MKEDRCGRDWIKVFSPATLGNLGPGYDVLGMAVEGLGDTVYARPTESGLTISSIKSRSPLPTDPDANTVTIAAREVLKILGVHGGIEFKIEKGLPIGSGLGSSAASAAAGAFAANHLYGELSKEELIMPATLAEEVISGGFFADNTAPALLGGATLTRSCEPLDVIRIGSIDDLIVVIVTPDLIVLTKDARAMLPEKVLLKDFVFNMANTSLITAAFSKNDYSLFARSINDNIIEPVRSTLIKGFDEVKKAALEAGADGMTISGSGPTVFAVTDCPDRAASIEAAMVSKFSENDVFCDSIVTRVDAEGTRLIQ